MNDFFSVVSEDVVMGGVLGGLPKVKPTGLPMLPPEVPGVVVVDDPPKLNFVPEDGNPPNGLGLSLSELVPPNRLVADEDAEAPNPPNGFTGFSVFVVPDPPNTLVVPVLSEVLDDPKREGVAVFSFSLSSLAPNMEVVDEPPNKLVVLEEEDPPNREPLDVELELELPNNGVNLGVSFGSSSVAFLAREEVKKFGMSEGGLLSGLVVVPKPNVGAGGPPEDSDIGAGTGGNVKLVDGFEPSVDVGSVKPPGLALKLAELFDPKVLEGAGVDILGADVVAEVGVLDKLGALNRIEGPGSGPSGSVFLGELPNEPVSCLSHTD